RHFRRRRPQDGWRAPLPAQGKRRRLPPAWAALPEEWRDSPPAWAALPEERRRSPPYWALQQEERRRSPPAWVQQEERERWPPRTPGREQSPAPDPLSREWTVAASLPPRQVPRASRGSCCRTFRSGRRDLAAPPA